MAPKYQAQVFAPDLDRMQRDVKALPLKMRQHVKKRLISAAAPVVSEIARRTPVGATGRLQRSTFARVTSALSVAVRNDARAQPWSRKRKTDNAFFYPRKPSAARDGTGKGYLYGKRLEFDKKAYGGRYAFFYPGFEAQKAAVIDEVSKVLADVGAEFKTGGT